MGTAQQLSLIEQATIVNDAGDFFELEGVFRVARGKSESSIEMPVTIRKDGSDLDDTLADVEKELCDLDSHAYTSASFSHFL
jgi:hypothetical protein